jgi:ribonuclease T2
MNTTLRLSGRSSAYRALALCLIAVSLAGFGACQGGRAQGRRERGRVGQFDSYVLALSWAPAFCAQGNNRSYRECDTRGHLGFVVHGLWPERSDGPVLEYCKRVPPVPYAIVEDMLSIMPDRGLIQHEWRAHGSCSGLSAREYFAVMKTAYAKLRIPQPFDRTRHQIRARPADIERLFQAANGMRTPDSVRIACRQGELTEIRICFSRNLEPIPCSNEVRECHSESLTVRSIP